MVHIVGVDLQDNLRVDYALTKIKGIGWYLAKTVLTSLGIDQTKRISDLTPEEITKIAAKLDEYPIEGELTRVVKGNIQRLKTIASYRGVRHSRSLPVRGQRTRTNARTKRGKRKTIGAFKKEALTKQLPPAKESKS